MASKSFNQGLKAGLSIGVTFIAIFTGVGITAGLAGIPDIATVLMTVLVFAGPAQFAMIDVGTQTGVLLQVVLVGILVNLRFLVMSLALTPVFESVPTRLMMRWAQFISASSFLVTYFESRKGAVADPYEFFKGVVVVSYAAAVLGTALGVWFGQGLPDLLQFGATLFLPVYFALLISNDMGGRRETTCVVLGFVFTPFVEMLVPGWGIFLVALTVGLVVAKGAP